MSKKLICLVSLILIVSPILMGQGSNVQRKIDSLQSVYKDTQVDTVKLRVLSELSSIYQRKDTPKSAEYAHQYLSLAKKLDDDRFLSKGYRSLGDVNRYLGNYDQSEEDYLQAIQYYEKTKDEVGKGMTYSSLSYLYKRQGRYPESLDASLISVALIEKSADEKMLSRAYHALASVYSYMVKRELSLEYYLKAARLNEKLGNNRLLGLNYSDIANLYLSEENYESAEEYLIKSLELIQKSNEPRSEIPPLVNIGIVYLETNRMSKAITSFQKALKISQDLKDPQKTGYCLDRLGDVYMKSGEYQKAIDEYNRSLLIWDEIGDIQGVSNCTFRIGLCLRNQGKNVASILKMNKALELINRTGFRLSKGEILKELSETYRQIGSYKLAFEHQIDLKNFEDSIFNRESEDRISDLRAEYDTEKKEQQIDLQEVNLREQRAVIAQQKAERMILIMLVASIILIALVIYYFYKKVKKANFHINQQNNEIIGQKQLIEKALGEREALLKEIHHRVKNNLQIIASLLHLQSGKQSDVNTKRLLAEGQGRIKSMALIHQKLYENKDLKNIPFSEYLEDLVMEIKKSFGTKMNNVKIHIDSDHILFDVDKAIPLGLIINELTTNSFKYAYKENEGGMLKIILKKNGGQCSLEVSDNGNGLPQLFDFKNADSLGLKLVRILSNQLEGECGITSENGTVFKLSFAA